MLLDAALDFAPSGLAEQARLVEAQGYDGAWVSELSHEPLLTLATIAGATSTLQLGTGIVVAFGRSPLLTAMMANDVQLLSHGRVILGLGSQVKAHIEHRYSMPWTRPAARMREYVLALRAIWSSWHEGTPLDFRGEFYNHTLMTPYFNPGPNEFGAPAVYLAAVGERMTEVAGEVADGLMVHSFTTERYLREVTLPALVRGCERAAKAPSDVAVSLACLIATGDNDEQLGLATRRARARIAFYGSTPAYKGVLELQRVLTDEGVADLAIGTNHVRAQIGAIRFTSKLIDGRFPDYSRVIPAAPAAAIRADRDVLRQALQRTAILSNEKYRGIRVAVKKDSVTVQAHNPEQEEAEEEIEVSYEGKDLEVGFNVNYLLDALSAIDGQEVELGLTDSNSSCLIRSPGSSNARYVVMPMRL